eukprot:scaffold2058_cov115-Isochrysis_galbana.AAC.7
MAARVSVPRWTGLSPHGLKVDRPLGRNPEEGLHSLEGRMRPVAIFTGGSGIAWSAARELFGWSISASLPISFQTSDPTVRRRTFVFLLLSAAPYLDRML